MIEFTEQGKSPIRVWEPVGAPMDPKVKVEPCDPGRVDPEEEDMVSEQDQQAVTVREPCDGIAVCRCQYGAGHAGACVCIHGWRRHDRRADR